MTTHEACLKAIETLNWGDNVDITPSSDPPDTTFVHFVIQPPPGTSVKKMRATGKVHVTNPAGLYVCTLDFGSIRINCYPQDLQAAYEHVKAWVLR